MHLQNLPINRCNPSPETTISQVTTYYTASVHHIKRYIHSYIFHCSSVFLQQCKHCCLHQNHISVQPCIKDTRFAGALRCLRANSTHLHFAFRAKDWKSSQISHSSLCFLYLWSFNFLICGMVHRNAISDFHSSVRSDTFASSEV